MSSTNGSTAPRKKNNLLVIRFKGINVTADHVEPIPGYQTFGKKLLGIFIGVCMKFASPKRQTKKIEVLKNVSGYVMPGTMTLLVGPPGSGKSTLLKVIEGKLPSDNNIRQEGVVLYNNNVLTSNVAPRKPIAYINEERNVHLPLFTVRETLEFAQQVLQQQTDDRFILNSAVPPELQGTENPYLETVLQMFGLKVIEHHKVGTLSDGITDGERTRLAIAEVAMGTHSVVLYDHPGTGQDSLLTYDVLEMLRNVIHVHQAAAVMAKAYVTPEVFYLYDHMILLSEGQVIFQGNPHAVEKYFDTLGYIKPSHIDIATFVQDIAAGDGAGYVKEGSKKMSIGELVKCYESSDHYKEVLRVVANHNVVNTFWADVSDTKVELSLRETDKGSDVLVTESKEFARSNSIAAGDKITGVFTPDGDVQYIAVEEESEKQRTEAAKVADLLEKPAPQRSLSIQVERRLDEHGDDACDTKRIDIWKWWLTTLLLIKRQAKFSIRLKRLILLRFAQVIIIGLFIGTLFYHKGGQLNQTDTNAVRAVGFVSMMHLLLINIVQLPVHIMVLRPVFYKQRAQHLYGVSSYVVAHGIVNIPQSLTEAFIYANCVYFFASLSRENASHYFHYWGVLFLIAYLGSWYMILVSAIAPVLEVATSLAGFLIVLNLLFSGFPVVLSVMRPYWKWMLYIMPTRWGTLIFTSTQIDSRYNVPCTNSPTLPFCLKYPTRSYGQAFLRFYSLEGGTRNLLIAYWVIIIYMIGVALLSYLAYRKIEIREPRPSIPRENTVETPEERRLQPDLKLAETGGVPEDLKWTSNLPVKPTTLSFVKLNFVVKHRTTGNDRVILNNVTGYAKPGTMLAIAGSLHSGKKTLLKCISGRAPRGRLDGDVLINGLHVDTLSFCRISGFVEKFEKHQPFLTIKETLEFNAHLRLGRHVTSSDRDIHVSQVLDLMALSKVGNQLVGTLKLSTGRFDEVSKKLAIAVELAGNPSVIFLEDPTYRLDSVAGRRILRLLQKVAGGGRTIVSTLDHPSGEALGLFDNALILKLGGEHVYFGPIGRDSSHMLEYFGSVSPVHYPDGGLSPLTHVLDVLGGGIKQRDPATDFTVAYQTSPLHKTNSEEIQRLLTTTDQQQDGAVRQQEASSRGYPASYGTQVTMVFLRNHKVLWRNVMYTFSRLAASIAVGLLMGTLFLQLDLEKVLQMTSASVLPYMQAIMISGLISNNVILQLGTDMAVYKRENRARMYAPVLYPLSWAVAELPYLLLATLVFAGISNGMAGVGVQSLSVFIRYWMGLFLFSVVVTTYGILITLLTRYPLLAVSLVSISTSVWISASGVTVPRNYVRFYRWLYWVDPFQYIVNINTSLAFFCDTTRAACRTCKIVQASCAGCGCARLKDVESQLARLFGPVQSQAVPAVFVWSRLQTSRVIEPHRMSKDFMALCIMIIVFVSLALVAFTVRHGLAGRRHRRRSTPVNSGS